MILLSRIVAWSLRHRAVVMMATALLVIVGIRSAVDLPMDAVPDVTNVQVQVITTAPALSPIEVEQYVSVPVERAMSGIPKVEEVRSISKYGLSVVTVAFDDGTDIYFARQMVLERMREAEEAVPAAYGRPEMGPISTGLGEIYQFVLRGEGHSLMCLKRTNRACQLAPFPFPPYPESNLAPAKAENSAPATPVVAEFASASASAASPG